MNEDITIEDIQTAQEQWMIGSTPEVKPLREEDWYIPQGVLKGILTIEDAIILRKAAGHFESIWLARDLGFDDFPVSIKFSDIDKKTKMTRDDPQIVGLWNEATWETEKIEGRDLTQEIYELFQEKYKTDLHLRNGSGQKERKISSLSEQKG